MFVWLYDSLQYHRVKKLFCEKLIHLLGKFLSAQVLRYDFSLRVNDVHAGDARHLEHLRYGAFPSFQ